MDGELIVAPLGVLDTVRCRYNAVQIWLISCISSCKNVCNIIHVRVYIDRQLDPIYIYANQVKAKACHLFGANPLPELVLIYCRLDPLELQCIWIHIQSFSDEKRPNGCWKCRLPNGTLLVQTAIGVAGMVFALSLSLRRNAWLIPGYIWTND